MNLVKNANEMKALRKKRKRLLSLMRSFKKLRERDTRNGYVVVSSKHDKSIEKKIGELAS